MTTDSKRSRIGNVVVVMLLSAAALAWFVREGAIVRPDVGASRWLATIAVLVAYGALCIAMGAKARRSRRPLAIADGTILVVHATQTGFAEELAVQAASAFRAAGHAVDLRPLSRVDIATLAAARVAFFIVATYGEGEAPDTSRRFAREMLAKTASLAGLRFGLLALGDRGYADFCGFGRALDAWLHAQGAERLFDAIEVDNGAAAALNAWRERLVPWTGAAATSMPGLPAFAPWTLTRRRLANEGGVGAAAFHVSLEAPRPAAVDWEAGDIAVVRLPDGAQREYSIASLPGDGRIDLLVRSALRPDGRVGLGAQWLTATLKIGETTDLRVRANHGFRLEGIAADTPLILIGNGTGIAGLRAHLAARIARGEQRNWLIFGERNAAFDRHYADDLDAWGRAGAIERIDYAFSRDDDGTPRVHVQHRVLEHRRLVAQWIADGAIVLVCGSATGMAGGVDAALKDIVGESALDGMAADGRYRRDVY